MTSRDSQTDETGYEVLAPLSGGTYGESLVAVRRDVYGLGKLFVLRQLRRGLSTDARVRETFLEIGRRAVRLSHTNLVQTFELGERGGALFSVTEYLEGEPLDAIMAAVAPAPQAVDPRFWLLIASDILSGLHYAHVLRDFDGSELELVHGGLTPRKIFVTYAGRVVVTDFGLAALAGHAKRLEGTFLPEMVAYTAPEQRDGRPSDARADVYSVGLILWELLAGRRHRQSNDPQAELEVPPLQEVKPEIDRALAAVVMRAIAFEPEDRWPSAAALRGALEPFLDRGGVIRRSALGEAIGALFTRSRDKIPSLLSKRAKPLPPQDAYAIALTGAPQSTSQRPEEEEEEAPFLLGAPIEAVSEANVLSVTELVSDSELMSSVEMIGSGADAVAADDDDAEEQAPESATPVSLSDLEIPVDEASAKSVGSIKAASAAKAPSTTPSKATTSDHAPDSGERPTLTETSAVWDEAQKSRRPAEALDEAPVEPSERLAAAPVAPSEAKDDAKDAKDEPKTKPAKAETKSPDAKPSTPSIDDAIAEKDVDA